MKASDLLTNIGNIVGYHSGLVRYFGSVTATVLFCQLYYWQGKERNPELGVYKTAKEIKEETGLTYAEQRTARRDLREIGVLVETPKRLEHRIYYRIDTDRLNDLLEIKTPEMQKVEFGNSENCNSGSEDSSVRITENTAETTHKEKTHVPDKTGNGTGETMSLKNRLSRAAVQLFGRCEPDNSPVWDRLKKQYKFSNERDVESAFYEWGGDGGFLENPIGAFLNDPSSSPRAVKEAKPTSDKESAKRKAAELSAKVALYTGAKGGRPIAFNEKQKKALLPACEAFDLDTIFSAFKRYWDGLTDKKSEDYAASQFSQQAMEWSMVEVAKLEEKKQRELDMQRLEEITQKAREEDARKDAERKAMLEEPIEF